MSKPIKWTRQGGNLTSVDGRFAIYPEYQGTGRPQDYALADTQTDFGKRISCGRLSWAKMEAQRRVDSEVHSVAKLPSQP